MNIATTADKATREDSPGVNLMPPIVFYACLIIGAAMELLLPQSFPMVVASVRIGVGLVLGIAGFWFMGIAHGKFKRTGINVPTNLPATGLVTQGAYRLSRNPMYVGGSAFFLGLGLAIGSLWMTAAYLPLGLYLSLYVIPREEAYMERVFGDEYRAYCRKVRRWL